MKNSFRSGFFTSLTITFVTLPAIFVGFFPITLIMGLITIVCLVMWLTMSYIYDDTEETPENQTYVAPVDTTGMVVGDDTKQNQPPSNPQ